MYLHVGNHKNIRKKDIIGIFDTDNATLSKTSRAFLATAQSRDQVISAREEIPKSFILYRERGRNRVCFSQLSSSALLRRIQSLEK